MCYEIRVNVLSFLYSYLVLASFVEMTPPPPLSCLGTFVKKSVELVCMGLILFSLLFYWSIS